MLIMLLLLVELVLKGLMIESSMPRIAVVKQIVKTRRWSNGPLLAAGNTCMLRKLNIYLIQRRG